jgi:hypothetical protein
LKQLSTMKLLLFFTLFATAAARCFDRYDSVAKVNESLFFFDGKDFNSDHVAGSVPDFFGIDLDYVNALYTDIDNHTWIISGFNAYNTSSGKTNRLNTDFGIDENVNAVLLYFNSVPLYITDYYVSDGRKRRLLAEMFYPRPSEKVTGAYLSDDGEVVMVTKNWSLWIYEKEDQIDGDDVEECNRRSDTECDENEERAAREKDTCMKHWFNDKWTLKSIQPLPYYAWRCPSSCQRLAFDSLVWYGDIMVLFYDDRFVIYRSSNQRATCVLNETLAEPIVRALSEARSLEAKSEIRKNYLERNISDAEEIEIFGELKELNESRGEEINETRNPIKIDAFFKFESEFYLISGLTYLKLAVGPEEWKKPFDERWLLQRGSVSETFGIYDKVNAAMTLTDYPYLDYDYRYLLFTDHYVYTNLGKKPLSHIFENSPKRPVVGCYLYVTILNLVTDDLLAHSYIPDFFGNDTYLKSVGTTTLKYFFPDELLCEEPFS